MEEKIIGNKIAWLPSMLIIVIGIPVVLWLAKESLYDEIVSEDASMQYKAFSKLRNDNNQRTDASLQKLLKTLSMKVSKVNGSTKNYRSKMLSSLEDEVVKELLKRGLREKIAPILLFTSVTEEETARKKALLTLMENHSDDYDLMIAIATGDFVDMDVYLHLMKLVDNEKKPLLYAAFINNKKLVDESVADRLHSISNIKTLVSSNNYKKLLALVEIPVVNIRGFGILEFTPYGQQKSTDGIPLGQWFVAKQTTTIPNKLGVKFGLHFEATRELSGLPINIEYETIYPQGGLTDPSTNQMLLNGTDQSKIDVDVEYIYYKEFENAWERKVGKWELLIKHKGQILAKKIFTVVSEKK